MLAIGRNRTLWLSLTRGQIPLNCKSSYGHEGRGIKYGPTLIFHHSLSLLTDLKANQVKPSSALFPGGPGDVVIHNGFRDAHSATAPGILAEVKRLVSTKGATSVVAVSRNLLRFAGANRDRW